MWRSPRISYLVGRLSKLKVSNVEVKHGRCCYSLMSPPPPPDLTTSKPQTKLHPPYHNAGEIPKNYIGENVSRKDKNKYLLTTLLDLNDSKEAIYGALDAWVAWEKNFPIASLKTILNALEKEQQWHRVVQVIKWMLSKGQGTTMGTYGQLIRALDMDHRVGEAQKFWEMKIGTDLHSVPWQLCHLMISVYYRNNMLEDLIGLFKGLEAFDRKPRDKSIIQKVANAYEMLGVVKEKERVLEKYSYLFTKEGPTNKNRTNSREVKKKGQQEESRKVSPVEKEKSAEFSEERT
ncbi:pentatricopeptide repeat-containing protein At4g18975, chloroplastic isoform X1 [Gastrolobium bilobum]|uniref:pentatricopeptide repeat-containing protein At4g18975, chloroplastic isoform X1 n=1 Tax=Gastrolobium bilobum TaxID=150636 RepID=UPI002AAFF2A4|nr:pentatricopeptide repeat-containing protein At4g18975, chloroplastic isoform X1 [Gastrolobium bilobum]